MVTAAAGLTVGLATAASAAVIVHGPESVVDEVPTANLEMCGNVYVSPDSAVEGATVTGNLYNSTGNLVTGPYQDETNSGGGWCIQGDATLADTIYNGGYVTVCVDPAAVNGKPFSFLGSGSDCVDIYEAEFNSHLYADPFNLIVASAKDIDAVAN